MGIARWAMYLEIYVIFCFLGAVTFHFTLLPQVVFMSLGRIYLIASAQQTLRQSVEIIKERVGLSCLNCFLTLLCLGGSINDNAWGGAIMAPPVVKYDRTSKCSNSANI